MFEGVKFIHALADLYVASTCSSRNKDLRGGGSHHLSILQLYSDSLESPFTVTEHGFSS